MFDLTADVLTSIDRMVDTLSQQIDRLAKAKDVESDPYMNERKMPRPVMGDYPKSDGAVMPSDKPSEVKKDEVPMAKPPTRAPTPTSPSHSLKKAGPVGALRDRAMQRQAQSQMAVDAHSAHVGATEEKAPKLSQEDQARRAAELAAFTPASEHAESANQGAHGGELELARPPKARSLASVRKAASSAK